jgi:peroxiredoxin
VIPLEIFAHAVRFVEVVTRTSLVNNAITIVVLTIAADLGFAVIRWFGAYPIVIPLLVFTHAVRFFEVIAILDILTKTFYTLRTRTIIL